MPTDIIMPNQGFDAQTGTLIEWLKHPGDTVRKGEAIAVIESDKADVELESLAEGVVLELLYQAGDVVPVGAVIARVEQAAELNQPRMDISPVAKRVARENRIDVAGVSGTGPRGRIVRQDVERHIAGVAPLAALPKVRRAAREAGISLQEVTATGSHGQVTMTDLQNFQHPARRDSDDQPADKTVQPALQPVARGSEITFSRMRQRIAERMVQSKREAPHFTVAGEFDLEAALRRLQEMPGVGINDLLHYFTVTALQKTPAINAHFDGGKYIQYPAVHLAFAVALPDGLVTPVIRDAQRFSLTGIAEISRDLVQRARAGRLRVDELQGGTFTVSNLGVVPQVQEFSAIINPPQVAILAAGAVIERLLVIDGGLHIRRTVRLCLSGDHRVLDGMHLAQFLAAWQAAIDQFVK